MNNIKYSILITVLVLSVSQVYAQSTFFNASKNEIEKCLSEKKAKLIRKYHEDSNFLIPYDHDVLVYKYPNNPDSTILAQYYLKDDKCLYYSLIFYGERFKNKMVASLNKPGSGFTPTNEPLEWLNREMSYTVNISSSNNTKTAYALVMTKIYTSK